MPRYLTLNATYRVAVRALSKLIDLDPPVRALAIGAHPDDELREAPGGHRTGHSAHGSERRAYAGRGGLGALGGRLELRLDARPVRLEEGRQGQLFA